MSVISHLPHSGGGDAQEKLLEKELVRGVSLVEWQVGSSYRQSWGRAANTVLKAEGMTPEVETRNLFKHLGPRDPKGRV